MKGSQMTPEQIAALEAPFQEHELESKPGRGGKMLTYVTTAAVTRRLNHVFAYAWSSEVTRLEVGESAVIATVRLTAEGIAHEQAGGQTIARDRDGRPIELGDDCKAAISYALKKCAMQFGIGLYLCEDEPEASSMRRDEGNAQEASPMQRHDPRHAPGSISEKQLGFIRALRKQLGYSPLQVQDLAEEETGNRDIPTLSSHQASLLIDALKTLSEAYIKEMPQSA